MKTFLTKMAPRTLLHIAQDCLGKDKATGDLVGKLIEWCKSYNINVADLRSRYPELENDPGLKSK